MKITNTMAKQLCDSLVDSLDVGGGGYIEIRDGSAPTNADDASTGTLLATLPLSATAFGSAADINPGARATAAAITADASADNTGTAGYWRAFRNDATPILQGTMAELVLNTNSIVAGVNVTVTSWTITMPES